MEYSIQNGNIVINNTKNFDINHILDCGQVFRFYKDNKKNKIIAKNAIYYLNYTNDSAIIISNDIKKAINYFDLDRDYQTIKNSINDNDIIKNAIDFGRGIRILNQDPLETIISFIISANNNIPRIRGILERICENLGEDLGDGYSFPDLDALASENESFFKEIGAGYRARYICDTVNVLRNGFDLDLYDVPTGSARKILMSLPGIGRKVADCILLFAYHKQDVFPMDIWCKRIYRDYGYESTKNCESMAQKMVDRYGEMSGYAQQYLFYYYRENHII